MATQTLEPRNLVARYANQLEPLPPTCAQLAVLVSQDSPDMKRVKELVTYDPVLTAKLLRMANSPMFGLRRSVGTVDEALVRLGTRTLFSIAIGVCSQPIIERNVPGYGISARRLWRHSMTAALATEVARECCTVKPPAFAFTAAILHDVGKLVLGRLLTSDILLKCAKFVSEERLEPYQAEMRVLDLHHGEVGAIIAQTWRLPDEIAHGIEHHHEPLDSSEPTALFAYLGNEAAHEIESRGARSESAQRVLASVKDRLGMTEAGFAKLVETTSTRLATMDR